jgi:hypothetical protein
MYPSHLSNGCEEMAHIIAAEVIRRPGRPAAIHCERELGLTGPSASPVAIQDQGCDLSPRCGDTHKLWSLAESRGAAQPVAERVDPPWAERG